jgi:hypothetical protein
MLAAAEQLVAEHASTNRASAINISARVERPDRICHRDGLRIVLQTQSAIRTRRPDDDLPSRQIAYCAAHTFYSQNLVMFW